MLNYNTRECGLDWQRHRNNFDLELRLQTRIVGNCISRAFSSLRGRSAPEKFSPNKLWTWILRLIGASCPGGDTDRLRELFIRVFSSIILWAQLLWSFRLGRAIKGKVNNNVTQCAYGSHYHSTESLWNLAYDGKSFDNLLSARVMEIFHLSSYLLWGSPKASTTCCTSLAEAFVESFSLMSSNESTSSLHVWRTKSLDLFVSQSTFPPTFCQSWLQQHTYLVALFVISVRNYLILFMKAAACKQSQSKCA